jgi:hypothetical protein
MPQKQTGAVRVCVRSGPIWTCRSVASELLMLSRPLYAAGLFDDQNELEIAVSWDAEMLLPLCQAK